MSLSMLSPYRAAAVGALLLLVATGCFKLSRNAPPVQRYALSTPASPSAVTNGVTIGIRRLELASYLDVPEIMVRVGANRLVASEFNRWGGSLSEAINRSVAAQLAAVRPVRAVEIAPFALRAQHDFLVQLRVLRFEGELSEGAPSGVARVQFAWDIIRPLTGAVLLRGATDQRDATWRAGDYAELVRGLDAGVAQVARDIGLCLSRFSNDSTPPASCGAGVVGR